MAWLQDAMGEEMIKDKLEETTLEDGWDEVEATLCASEKAQSDERERCAAIVLGELERGRLRGVPETAGTMIILHRIVGAITNG